MVMVAGAEWPREVVGEGLSARRVAIVMGSEGVAG